MSSSIVGVITFSFTFCGLLAGMRLGRILPAAHLQGDAKESIRTGIGLIKVIVSSRIHLVGAPASTLAAKSTDESASAAVRLATEVRSLAPKNDEQAWLKSRATELTESMLEVRLRVIGRVGSSVPASFLIVLAFWLTVTFAS